VSILPHEAKTLLENIFSIKQSYLAKYKISPVVVLPHETK